MDLESRHEYFRKGMGVNGSETIGLFMPLVQRRIHENFDSEAVPISQAWYDYKDNYLDTELVSLEGWERYENSD
jgi:hypothetical protein